MNQDEIRDELVNSAQRWARTAIDAYLEEPADQDFAVHHMAVAVEHLAKACLVSVAITLLANPKPSLEDLLVLGRKAIDSPGERLFRSQERVAVADALARRLLALGDLDMSDIHAVRLV